MKPSERIENIQEIIFHPLISNKCNRFTNKVKINLKEVLKEKLTNIVIVIYFRIFDSIYKHII